jgi:hypothetical protein
VVIPKPAPQPQSEGSFSNVDPWEAEAIKMNNQNIFSRLIDIETRNAVLVNKVTDETRKTVALRQEIHELHLSRDIDSKKSMTLKNKLIEQDTIQDTIHRLQSINSQQKEASLKYIKENTFFKENLKKLQNEISNFKKSSETTLETLKVTFSKEKTDFLFHIKTLKGL